jgi:nicotinamide-nucleotide amidase
MAELASVLRLLQLARENALQITTAESCTGGLLAGAITEIPGASDIYSRGFITYSNAAKIDMLGVKRATLENHGAVSAQVAGEMASGALAAAQADVAISVTGIAGPGGSDNKPEGRVWFALARKNHPVRTETEEFGALGRGVVRMQSVNHAIDMLVAELS